MSFFTIYKFELKKILFISFAAIFIMYFLSIIMFNRNLNEALEGYIEFRNLQYINLYPNITGANLIWIVIMAFIQFHNFNIKERGNLPFNKNKLFLSTVLAGVTIIAISILFYWVICSFEYFRYSFVFDEIGSVMSNTFLGYKKGFGIFTFNTFNMFLVLFLAYLTVIIFIFSFKNPIVACILWGVGNIAFYNIVNISEKNVAVNFLSLINWFDYDFDPYYIGELNVICSTGNFNTYFQILKIIFTISYVFLCYMISINMFYKESFNLKNAVAKCRLGEFFIFAVSAMIVFSILYEGFSYRGYNPYALSKIMIFIISIISGIIILFITKIWNKGGAKQ